LWIELVGAGWYTCGLDIDLQLDAPPDRVAARAAELASTGIRGLFTFEGPHDVFLPLAQAAGADVELMTNVAIALPRSAVHLAHAAWDLQLLSQGRFRLGLGSQVRAHVVHRHGATWDRPAAQMRDKVAAVRAVLRAWQERTPLDFTGEYSRLTLMAPTFDPGPNPYGPPPVLLGALGPVMTRTAAEVADGLLIMPFNSARHLRERTLPAVERGLARRPADVGPFALYPQAIVGLDAGDVETALLGVRRLLGFYGSTPAYRPVLEVEGYAALHDDLYALARAGRFAELAALVPAELVRRIAVIGTPAECAAELAARFGSLGERVCCYFPGQDPPLPAIAELVAAARG
jgi:probable F420-dependent oxidoreductase